MTSNAEMTTATSSQLVLTPQMTAVNKVMNLINYVQNFFSLLLHALSVLAIRKLIIFIFFCEHFEMTKTCLTDNGRCIKITSLSTWNFENRFTIQSFDFTDSVDIAEEGATTLSLKDPVREVPVRNPNKTDNNSSNVDFPLWLMSVLNLTL